MEIITLERAVEVVRALTPAEQQQLRQLMDTWQTPAQTTPAQERLFAQHLLDIGMIDHLPEGYLEGYVPPAPIVLQGEPLSETVIRERR